MHETYSKLRPGTLVLAICEAHVYNIVQNSQPTSVTITDMCDEATKVIFLEWPTMFKKECSAGYVASADDVLATCEYDRAIESYSAAIDLGAMTDTLFANRCRAKLGKMS